MTEKYKCYIRVLFSLCFRESDLLVDYHRTFVSMKKMVQMYRMYCIA